LDSGNATYSRGQVEWALWQLFTQDRSAPVPKVFNSRIRKFWELGIPIQREERPGTGPAFQYTLYHCFELAFALRLQDAGFAKHSEIGELVCWQRGSLQEQFSLILTGEGRCIYFAFGFKEIKEAFPGSLPLGLVLVEPHYYVGIEDLTKSLAQLKGRARIVIELAGIVEDLKIFLAKAPEFKKGRPRGSA
jgi:hypothetical protein